MFKIIKQKNKKEYLKGTVQQKMADVNLKKGHKLKFIKIVDVPVCVVFVCLKN